MHGGNRQVNPEFGIFGLILERFEPRLAVDRRQWSSSKSLPGCWQPCGVRSLPLPLGRPCRLRRDLWRHHLVGDRHHSPLQTFPRRYQAPPASNPQHTTLLLPRRRRQHPPTSAPVLVASGPTARRTHLFRWMSFAIRSPDCNG